MRKVNVSEVIANSKMNSFFRSVFTVCLFVIIFNGYNQSIYGIALPSLMADTGISPTVFGLIGTYTLFGMFIGSLVFGMIADRIGRVKAMILGVAIFCIGSGMFGFSHTAVEFSIYRILAGFGMAGVVPVCLPTVTEYSPAKNRAVMTSWTTSGVPIGAVVTPLIGMALLPHVGWRMIYISCFIPLIIIFFIIKIVPESMERLVSAGKKEDIQKILKKADPGFEPQPDDEYVTASSASGKTKSSLKDLFTEGRGRTTVLFWITFFCSMFFTYGMQTWLPSIMIQAGFPITNSMVFMFVYAFGSIPALMAVGKLTSRFGYKKSVMMLMALAAVSIALLSFQPATPIMYLLLFLAGAGMYGETAIFYTYISMSYPNSVRSTGMGFASAVGRIGGMFGPTVGGLLASIGAPLSACFLTFAIPMGIAALCVSLTKENVTE